MTLASDQNRLAVISGACVLGLLLTAGGAGVAAYEVMRLQSASTQAISLLGEVNSRAGRIEAVVAGLADARTDPASLDGLRGELVTSADRLDAVASIISPSGADRRTPETADPLVRSLLRSAASRSDTDLGQTIQGYAQAGRAAAQPGTPLYPGALTRGSIDGEYPGLVSDTGQVARIVRASELRSSQRWREVVVAGVIALCLAGTALAGLVIGPLTVLARRQRIRDRKSLQEKLDSAAYIAQVVDSVDVAVIAIATNGARPTINAAARFLLGITTDAGLDPEALPGAAQLWAPGAEHPLPGSSMPLARALAGEHVDATELRLVLGPHAAAATPADPLAESRHGERRVVVRAGPLTAADNAVVGAVATFQDVTQLHVTNRLLTRKAGEMAAIFQATRAVLREDNAREALCQATASISGAVVVGLFEDDGHGDLVCSTAIGADMLGFRIAKRSPSILADAFASARTRILIRVTMETRVDHTIIDRLSELSGRELGSGACIPVISAGRCLAVIGLGFEGSVDATGHVPALEILATETAVAIERQDLLIRLALEAETDALTGTANRRAWDTLLQAAINEAAATGRQLTVIMLDFDHFKTYNDTRGHPAGDAILRQATAAWRSRLHPGDVLARYGGEEFAVLLPDCGTPEGVTVAQALRNLMPGSQTCSAGVATWNGTETGAELVAHADTALYEAKTAGRDRTRMRIEAPANH